MGLVPTRRIIYDGTRHWLVLTVKEVEAIRLAGREHEMAVFDGELCMQVILEVATP